jgi:phosphoribosyl 1,2-cyclic phosphodiesterase
MKIKFWGVRGSIPCPGPQTLKYGGNTLCVELRLENPDRLIIIDAGTGIRELGNHMMAHDLPNGLMTAEIFLTHTHWDHIQGFPFFLPIYVPKTKVKVYGPVTYEEDTIKDVLGGQWIYRYFPVRQAELASEMEYVDLKEGRFDLGDGLMLTTKYLNHPLLCLGYRFEYGGKVFCTAFDTEPFQNIFSTDPSGPSYDEAVVEEAELVAKEENQRLEEFYYGADLLIYDTQYTQEEYEPSKVGWGHSSIEYAIAAAKRSKVKRLSLFHHEPVRTDAKIDELAKKYCNSDSGNGTKVFFAREGMEIQL